MRWCSNNSDLLEYGPDPSLCFTETFALFIVNLIAIGAVIFRYLIVQQLDPFDYTNIRNAKILLFVNVLALLIGIFTLILGFAAINAVSSILYLATNLLLWLVTVNTIKAESKRLARWPSVWIIVIVAINLVGHVLLASVIFQTMSSRLFLCCAAGSVASIFAVLVTIALKDIFRSADEIDAEEMQRYSIEFTTNSPIRPEQNHLCGRLAGALSLSFSSNPDQTALAMRPSTATVRMTKLDYSQSESSWMKMWPFRPSTSMRGSDFQSLLDEDLLDHDDEEGFATGQHNNSHRNSSASSLRGSDRRSYHQIESAIDRNIQGNFVSPKPEKDHAKSSASSFFLSSRNRSKGESVDSSAPSFAERDSEYSTHSGYSGHGRDSLGTIGGSNASRTGRVVSQVLEEHRARMSASNPLLEPRGLDANSQSEGRMDDHMMSSSSLAQQGSPGRLAAKQKKSLRVTVQRWGYRTRKGAGDRVNNNINLNNKALLGGVETEFEIIAATSSNNNNNNSSGTSRWTIWRTVSEIYRLHSTMVGHLGDFAPRRPPLRSDSAKPPSGTSTAAINNTASGVNAADEQVDFAADMRALTVYFNALLRVDYHDNQHFVPLLEFLSVPREFLGVPSSSGATAGDGVDGDLTDDNGRASVHSQQPLPPSLLAYEAAVAANNGTGSGNNSGDAGSGKISPHRAISGPAAGAAANNSTSTNSPHNASVTAGVTSTSNTSSHANKSLMDTAHQQQADANQQEKWRKLVFQMKMKLKPRDIAVRCRHFEGVISGGDIAKFLMYGVNNASTTTTAGTSSSTNANTNTNANAGTASTASANASGATSPLPDNNAGTGAGTTSSLSPTSSSATLVVVNNVEAYEVARDRFEAIRIGQELLSCGLLRPVSLGFAGDDEDGHHRLDEDYDVDDEDLDGGLAGGEGQVSDELDDNSRGKGTSAVQKSKAHKKATGESLAIDTTNLHQQSQSSHEAQQHPLVFSDLDGFIFRFPGKSGTAGVCALFGTKASVRIPTMDFSDESDAARPVGRETVTLTVLESEGVVVGGAAGENGLLGDAGNERNRTVANIY